MSAEEDEDDEEEDEEVKDSSQPRHTIWLDVESSREAAHWLPWRPDKAKGQSEEDCEDPDRQVLLLTLCVCTLLFIFIQNMCDSIHVTHSNHFDLFSYC